MIRERYGELILADHTLMIEWIILHYITTHCAVYFTAYFMHCVTLCSKLAEISAKSIFVESHVAHNWDSDAAVLVTDCDREHCNHDAANNDISNARQLPRHSQRSHAREICSQWFKSATDTNTAQLWIDRIDRDHEIIKPTSALITVNDD